MIKPFDFYFDFVSPYSFLAHKEIKKIQNKASIKVRYKPILLGGLHNLHGIKAPAFIPAKPKHMIRDCKLIAERNNVKFKFNSYFPIRSLNLMRGVFVAEEDNYKSYYIDNIFDAIWQDGSNMNDDNIIQKILLFETNVGAPKTPFSYASLVCFFKLSFIDEEVALKAKVLGFTFRFFKTF